MARARRADPLQELLAQSVLEACDLRQREEVVSACDRSQLRCAVCVESCKSGRDPTKELSCFGGQNQVCPLAVLAERCAGCVEDMKPCEVAGVAYVIEGECVASARPPSNQEKDMLLGV